jgi:predicted RNA binding protein YcfA (HicA-like mRNA interferase family)
MKTPRDLQGRDRADCLCRQGGYREVGQTGSHIILQTEEPSHQRLPVPAHKNLRVGTLNAILRLVANHKRVTREKILEFIV